MGPSGIQLHHLLIMKPQLCSAQQTVLTRPSTTYTYHVSELDGKPIITAHELNSRPIPVVYELDSKSNHPDSVTSSKVVNSSVTSNINQLSLNTSTQPPLQLSVHSFKTIVLILRC